MNFNPYYRVSDPQHAIQQRRYTSNMYQITCPVDVLSSDVQLSTEVSAIYSVNQTITISGHNMAKVGTGSSHPCTNRGGGRAKGLSSSVQKVMTVVFFSEWLPKSSYHVIHSAAR